MNRQLSDIGRTAVAWQVCDPDPTVLPEAVTALNALPSLILGKSSQSLSPIYGHPSSPFAPALSHCDTDSPIRAAQYPVGGTNSVSPDGNGTNGELCFGLGQTGAQIQLNPNGQANRSLSLPVSRTEVRDVPPPVQLP